MSCNTHHAAGNSQAEEQAAKSSAFTVAAPGMSTVAICHQQPAIVAGLCSGGYVSVCAHYWVFVSFVLFPPVGVLKTQIMQITPVTVQVGQGELEPTKPQGAREARGCSCPNRH